MVRAKKPTKTPDSPADEAVAQPNSGAHWNKISAGIVGIAALSGAVVTIGNNTSHILSWFITGDDVGEARNEAARAPRETIKTTETTTTRQTTVTPSGETTTTERRTEVIREVIVASSGPRPPAERPPPYPLPSRPPPPLPPPPPPDYQQEQQQIPPLPTPCVSGPFIVFFDWDRDAITPQAAAILDNAAAAYQQCGLTRFVVAGHADRSGPANYNVGLSERRANNTRSYLAEHGVPDGSITTEAFGESRPLVETADGVREPQNRRVEVTFGPDSGW